MTTLASIAAAYAAAIDMDAETGRLAGGALVERRLSDLEGCFVDAAALDATLAEGDPVVYTVSALEPGSGDGDLHLGLGVLMPGRVGDEFFLTKGHYHSWREAGEYYIGLRGHGGLLLEDEEGLSRLVPFGTGQLVYVPGSTAHRTVNTGAEPLVYLGVYSAKAGHDYAAIAADNFRQVVLAGENGAPVVRNRSELVPSGKD
ncbi:MAG: hypothetical protein JWP66_127 [Naasia sp.]|nr:hypothetical protein [Naasia sp.]